ncbi:MAG: hypothetical protein JKY86_03070 [Gammaproteobacteria bacterium]|nr:hypothetical protein [Gammaproteobacteria bacterium]
MRQQRIAADKQRLESDFWNYEIGGVCQIERSNKKNRNRIAKMIRMFDASCYGFNTKIDFTAYPLESAQPILERERESRSQFHHHP